MLYHWCLKQALTELKGSLHKNNLNFRICDIIKEYKICDHNNIHVSKINMNDVKNKLQETHIKIWKEKLFDDVRVSGGNKLCTYRIFKEVFEWEHYFICLQF